jgi:hypothetical protein
LGINTNGAQHQTQRVDVGTGSQIPAQRGRERRATRSVSREIASFAHGDDESGIRQGFERRDYQQGEMIVQQGERGDEFFVIESGLAEVVINGKFVREMGAGRHFGELALQTYGSVRSATVIASSSPTVVLAVSKRDFDKKIRPNMPRFQKKLDKHQSDSSGSGEPDAGLGDVLADLLLRKSGLGLREVALKHNGGIGKVFETEGAAKQRGGAVETLSFALQVSMLLWLIVLLFSASALVMIIGDFRPWQICFTCGDMMRIWIIWMTVAFLLLFAAALIVSSIQAQIPGFDPRSPCDRKKVVSRVDDGEETGTERGGIHGSFEFESPLYKHT